jgi:hypothetical protein
MRAFVAWIVIVGILAAVYSFIPKGMREEGRRPLPPDWTRPAPPPPPAAPTPPGITPMPSPQRAERPPLRGQDFILTVNSDGPRASDSLGTAFALNTAGVWLTAAHVIDECRAVYVLRGRDWRGATSVRIHPSADLALIRAVETGPTVTLAAAATPDLGTDAFHIGYPQGRPAQVHTRYIGRARIERPQRGMPPEPGHVWVEVARVPDFEGSLGGLSGGPAFDSSGRVIGVTILESQRRGRITTAPVERIRDMLNRGAVEVVPGAGTGTFSPSSFQTTADALRAGGTVTHIFCSWRGDTRPRRR